jgi:phosphoribosylformimino-5-aminoimidazole carboxamide ribotide isomerase
MLIIPAVDLMGGRAVRLRQGKKTDQTIYFDDPVEPAAAFARDGAKLIHVVDLDGAFEGRSKNTESVKRIVRAVSPHAAVELGGGIRNIESIERCLELGVSRVILGTAILKEPSLLPRAVEKFGGERIVVGLDARDGKVAIRGWEEVTGLDALTVAHKAAGAGALRIIYTDIATDGMLAGPNLEALKKICQAGLAVIASGGIATLEHVRAVASLEKLGIEGMIIGKAFYDGRIVLKKAIAAAGEPAVE